MTSQLDDDVFRAILALDSYNRGPDAGVELPSQGSIGDAAIKTDSVGRLPGSEATGFYAAAYDWTPTAALRQ